MRYNIRKALSVVPALLHTQCSLLIKKIMIKPTHLQRIQSGIKICMLYKKVIYTMENIRSQHSYKLVSRVPGTMKSMSFWKHGNFTPLFLER